MILPHCLIYPGLWPTQQAIYLSHLQSTAYPPTPKTTTYTTAMTIQQSLDQYKPVAQSPPSELYPTPQLMYWSSHQNHHQQCILTASTSYIALSYASRQSSYLPTSCHPTRHTDTDRNNRPLVHHTITQLLQLDRQLNRHRETHH